MGMGMALPLCRAALQELGPGTAVEGELQGSARAGVSALGMWHPPRFPGSLFRGAEGSLGHRDRAVESRSTVTDSEVLDARCI